MSNGSLATLSSLKIVRVSLSGAATITVRKHRLVQVELNPARLRDVDELILAEEVEDCALAAFAEIEQVSRRIVAERELTAPCLRTDFEQWRAGLDAELERLEVIETSSGDLVEVVLNGEPDLAITIRHNAVRRTDISVPTLEHELNEAIERAGAAYGAAAMRIRRVHGERL